MENKTEWTKRRKTDIIITSFIMLTTVKKWCYWWYLSQQIHYWQVWYAFFTI